MIQDKRIDHGKGVDWGRVSEDYGKYRDIYPLEFYRKIRDLGCCVQGQKVLDVGTGTGVLPRNLYSFGATFTGTDISLEQIQEANRLAEQAGMGIDFRCLPAESDAFPDNFFDVITACQCFFYFDHEAFSAQAKRMLKPGGRLLLLYMAWLPFEDVIAGKSEDLILQYNPSGRDVKKPDIQS